MIGASAQKYLAIKEGHTMALRATYNDAQVQKANPWFKTVIPQLIIRPRPTSPVYNDISLKMQQDFHQVLTGAMQPAAAVKDIESFISLAESRFH
jgi:maltose-binding protein MalE